MFSCLNSSQKGEDGCLFALGRHWKHGGLDDDGMIRPAEKVEDGQCLANKITPADTKGLQELTGSEAKYKSTPVNYKNPVSSYIAPRFLNAFRLVIGSDWSILLAFRTVCWSRRTPKA